MAERTDTVEVYKAKDGWRWRYRASNGRIMADGSEGYENKDDAIGGARQVIGVDGFAVIEVQG